MPRTGPLWSGVGNVPGHSKRPETNWLHLQETLRGHSRRNCPWVKSNWFFLPPFNKLDFNLIKTHLQKSAQIPFLASSFFFSHAAYEFYMQLIIQLKNQSTASFPQPLQLLPHWRQALFRLPFLTVLPDFESYINGITSYVLGCVWSCLLNTVKFTRCEFIMLRVCGSYHSCYGRVSHSMNIQPLIRSADNHYVISSLVPKCSHLWPAVYTFSSRA